MKLQTMPLRFRVWDKDTNDWAAPSVIFDDIKWVMQENGGIEFVAHDPSLLISQDTGLKDDEGQEIFERDILKNADGVGVVEYETPYFQLRYNYKHTSRVIQGVIVGNVWQTPELVEEK